MTPKKRKTYKRRNKKIRLILLNLIALTLFILLLITMLNTLIPIAKSSYERNLGENIYKVKLSDEELNDLTTTAADEINLYGESINLTGSALGDEYQINLYNTTSKKSNGVINLSSKIDKGINSHDLPVGSFFLQLEDESFISYDQELNLDFNTITRDGETNRVTVDTVNDIVHITKYTAETENDELDILVDAGHGGNDPGSSSNDGTVLEKDLNLQLATLIANDLTELGYNVGLTRTDDTNPGTCEDNISSYCSDGRVSMAYNESAKIVLSVHHNTGGAQGYEVYTSYYASEALANLVAASLADVSTPSTKETGYISDGVYQQVFTDESYPEIVQDYMYMIRETGGIATRSVTTENVENNTKNYGSQGLLIEFGYLDNDTDLAHLTNEDVIAQEADAVVSAVNSYIQETPTTVIEA